MKDWTLLQPADLRRRRNGRLQDVFRYGSEIKENTIVRDYTGGVVEIVIKPDESADIEGRFIVISCCRWDCD
jgi:hypothetical protein